MSVEDVFKRLTSGKWEGRRIIDVAAGDPVWCKRSVARVSSNEYGSAVLKALEIVERTGYEPEFPIDDPRSLSSSPRICNECGEKTETFLSKAANTVCFVCYEGKM